MRVLLLLIEKFFGNYLGNSLNVLSIDVYQWKIIDKNLGIMYGINFLSHLTPELTFKRE